MRSFYERQNSILSHGLLFHALRIIAQYMLLYYFSVLVRYHSLEWQRLLEGVSEPEGNVFRVALEQVASDYLQEITSFLPRPDEGERWNVPPVWQEARPDLDTWYAPPTEQRDGVVLALPRYYSLSEWDGNPGMICPGKHG